MIVRLLVAGVVCSLIAASAGLLFDQVSPRVAAMMPRDGATEVYPGLPIAVAFSRAMAPETINPAALALREEGGTALPVAVAYDAASLSARLTPLAPLRPGASYRIAVGPTPASTLGLGLRETAEGRFTLAAAPVRPDAPAAPVLVAVGGKNPLGAYYAEILRAEGLNLFAVVAPEALTQERLAAASLVLMTEAPDEPLAARLAAWVEEGGNLIAIRPHGAWLPLFGLAAAGEAQSGDPLAERYLQADAEAPAARGIVGVAMQFHGPATRYALGDATALARFSTGTDTLPWPAVSLRRVGQGQTAAFAFDLATSVVRLRQGNPAFVGQERDGLPPRRPNDLFFPDYLDLSRVAIPQADEQQRLLANLIVTMSAGRLPLPRVWYLPDERRAALIMAGDDHATRYGTLNAYKRLVAESPLDCKPDSWDCARATSYITPETRLPAEQAQAYAALGFETAAHVDTGCRDVDAAVLGLALSRQAGAVATRLGLPPQTTHRLHCIAWNGWADTAKIERAAGIRLDLGYYYWPGSWIRRRPGFMTGSGFPQRFADLDGRVLDIYQAASHLVNENGIAQRRGIEVMLDRALGPEQFFGAFGTHYDYTDGYFDHLVSAARERGVALISAAQMLRWLDRREATRFEALAWNGHDLTFRVSLTDGPERVTGMLPVSALSHRLAAITRGGQRVPFRVESIKGLDYAMFDLEAGSYAVLYDEKTSAMPLPARLR
ncbi:Ig-like domain-containing protein [Methylobacterium terricola]|nr:Ig-like domain-containing protein [Methylobacterium terricola]